MKSKSKWVIRWSIVGVIIEIFYVVGANYFLRSDKLFEIINTHPNSTYIHYENAWTALPGLVHVEKFLLRDQDQNVQWSVEIDKASLLINLLALPFRRLHVMYVRASGARFRLRLQESVINNKSGIPDILGFEGPPEPSQRDPNARFRFSFHQVTIHDLNEIWMDDHRFEGQATAGGSFYVWPTQEFDVSGARVEIDSGQIKTLSEVVAENLSGHVSTTVRLFPTPEKSGSEVLDYVSGSMDLRGKLGRADFLNVYLQKLDWIHFEDMNGDFNSQVSIEEGVIGAPSEISITVHDVSAKIARTKMSGSGKLKWARENRDQPAVLDLRLGHYEFKDAQSKNTLMTGEGFDFQAQTREPHLRDMWKQVAVHFEMPSTEIQDLAFLNTFIPSYSRLEVVGGRSNLKGILNVDSLGVADLSLFQILANDLSIKIDRKRLRGDLRFDARLKDIEVGDQIFDVSGTKISFERVFSSLQDSGAGSDADWIARHLPWSGEVSIDSGHLSPDAEVVFDGKVSLSLLDLRPLLDLYSVKSGVAPWVKSVLKVKNVTAKADLQIGRKEMVLRNLDLKSEGLNLKGWLKVGAKSKQGAILVELNLMTVGLEMNESGTKVILSGAKEWFQNLGKQ